MLHSALVVPCSGWIVHWKWHLFFTLFPVQFHWWVCSVRSCMCVCVWSFSACGLSKAISLSRFSLPCTIDGAARDIFELMLLNCQPSTNFAINGNHNVRARRQVTISRVNLWMMYIWTELQQKNKIAKSSASFQFPFISNFAPHQINCLCGFCDGLFSSAATDPSNSSIQDAFYCSLVAILMRRREKIVNVFELFKCHKVNRFQYDIGAHSHSMPVANHIPIANWKAVHIGINNQIVYRIQRPCSIPTINKFITSN